MSDASRDYSAIHEPVRDRLVERGLQWFQQDRFGFIDWFCEGWSRRDLNRVIAGGEVLRACDKLGSGKHRLRFVSALLAVERWGDAADLMQQVLAGQPDNAAYLVLLSAALAGLGRFVEALAAARRARELGPAGRGADANARRAILERLCALDPAVDAEAGGKDWRRFVEGCAAVGAWRRIAASAQQLAGRPDTLAAAHPEDRRAVLGVMIRAGAAGDLAPMLGELRRRLPQEADLITLQAEAALAQGAPASARAILSRAGPKGARVAAAVELAVGRRREAITALASLAGQRSKDHEVLRPLARAVGEEVLEGAPLPYRRGGGRKVFNLLPFSNELTLLKLRMAEMAHWVDYFVLVESRQTFTGLAKPLQFEAARAEFAEFLPKILHVRLDGFPEHLAGAWARDYHQRDMAVTALAGLWAPDDVVILTDADEIIRPVALERFDGELMGLETTNHRFFFNYTAYDGDRPRSRRSSTICRASVLRRYGASYLRFYLTWLKKDWNAIPNAGWHFTSMNSADQVALKFRSFAHTEAVRAGWGEHERVAAVLSDIRANAFEPGWRRQELDDSFPAYVIANREALTDYIL